MFSSSDGPTTTDVHLPHAQVALKFPFAAYIRIIASFAASLASTSQSSGEPLLKYPFFRS